MLLHKLLLVLLVSLPLNGICGLLIEPYAGYTALKTSGTVEALGLTLDIDEGSPKGMTYGGRVGYGIANLGIGLDYMSGQLKSDGDKSVTNSIGGFAMANFWLIRVWGEYIFSSKHSDNDPDIDGTLTGKGTKFGVGFSVLPMVSLNIEYMMLNYKDEDIDLIDAIDLDAKGVLVSISIPIVL